MSILFELPLEVYDLHGKEYCYGSDPLTPEQLEALERHRGLYETSIALNIPLGIIVATVVVLGVLKYFHVF